MYADHRSGKDGGTFRFYRDKFTFYERAERRPRHNKLGRQGLPGGIFRHDLNGIKAADICSPHFVSLRWYRIICLFDIAFASQIWKPLSKLAVNMAEDNRVPVWLDCDPGHDDVFAILLAAYHPGIRLLGISTVFGNATLEKTTWNATSVLTAISKHQEIPVYQGLASPLVRPHLSENAEDIHGESGLDGTELLPEPLVKPRTDVPALDAAAAALRSCKPGTAWLVATGSLTNAAKLFQLHPDLVGHIKGLSIMGGAIGDGFTSAVYGVVDGKARVGNWTPWAEFNIIIDPEAAAFIFDTKELAAKTTILPLDVTHLVLARQDVQELLLYGADKAGLDDGKTRPVETTGARVGKTVLRTMLVELLMFFAKTYKEVFGIIEGPPLHDPLAVAAVLTGTPWEIPIYECDPNSSSEFPNKRERFDIKVITEGTHDDALHRGSQLGRTVATPLPPGAEGVRIPRGLDIEKFWMVLEECVQKADEANERALQAAPTTVPAVA